MTTNCNTSIVQVLESDLCNGNRMSTECIIHPTIIPSLSLITAPITQKDVNDKLVLALQSAATRITILEGASTIPIYKLYVALLSQVGTNAPTAIVLGNNTIGGIIWTRQSAGVYIGTLTGAFTAQKTFINLANATRIDANTIRINTTVDSTLNETSLEVRVYN